MHRKQQEYIQSWFSRPKRKPLIIRGARQVGKSTLVRDFAAHNNHTLHEVNLEEHRELAPVFQTNNAARIFQELQFVIGKGSVTKPSSILFLDEIQAIPHALEALRYLAEHAPSLPIVCAGSLLEFALGEKNFSMPVGRIEYLFMGPVSFEEFLLASQEQELLEYLRKYSLHDGNFSCIAHEKLIHLYRIFCVVGGMPEVSHCYLQTQDFREVRRMQSALISTYRDDFGKYATGSSLRHLQKMLDYVAISLGEKVKYVNVDRDAKSGDLKKALFLLTKAQVIELAYHTSGSGLPLRGQVNENIFKPYYVDCGLISYLLGNQTPTSRLMMGADEGKLAEQFIAQHIVGLGEPWEKQELFYWLREEKQKNAEVDFLIACHGNILPLEVKSGKTGTLKSLHQFMAIKHAPCAVRFSVMPAQVDEVLFAVSQGKTTGSFQLISLPFYLVEQVERIVKEHLG